MLNGLQTTLWCTYSESEDFIVSYTGGRQGCKLAGHGFGSGFALAMTMLYERLRKEGIILQPFWSDIDAPSAETEVLDAFFLH